MEDHDLKDADDDSMLEPSDHSDTDSVSYAISDLYVYTYRTTIIVMAACKILFKSMSTIIK